MLVVQAEPHAIVMNRFGRAAPNCSIWVQKAQNAFHTNSFRTVLFAHAVVTRKKRRGGGKDKQAWPNMFIDNSARRPLIDPLAVLLNIIGKRKNFPVFRTRWDECIMTAGS